MKRNLLFVLLIACILLSVSAASAGDVNDTALANEKTDFTADSSVNDLKASANDENPAVAESGSLIDKADNGTYTELQFKIDIAEDGSTLNLYNDYKYNDDFKIINGIFINKDITIDGNGHTIDGMGKARIFNINYGDGLKHYTVTLKNIKFKNGYANIYGGAILNFANLTVDQCTFTGNNAGTAGGAINSLGALKLTNSVFDKNTAGGDAGAVFSLTIKKSLEFYKNYFAGRNATADTNLLLAIMQAGLEPGKDTISNCVFTNNVAKGRGGGAVYGYSHLSVDSCTFKSNTAGENGGAVFGNKDLYIKNSKFSYNSVKKFGGAVYFRCHELTGHYEGGKWVSDVKFYNNLIESSTFIKNAAKQGGAIFGFKASEADKIHGAKAVKCTFEENKAQKGRDVYGGTTSKCTFIYYKITLKKAAVKKSAKKLVLKATLKKANKAVKGQKVTFKFKGKTYKAKTNKKGIAKVTVKKSVLKKLKVGKKVTYTATYKASYGKETAKKTVKVKK